jgi:hypothetical protein
VPSPDTNCGRIIGAAYIKVVAVFCHDFGAVFSIGWFRSPRDADKSVVPKCCVARDGCGDANVPSVAVGINDTPEYATQFDRNANHFR